MLVFLMHTKEFVDHLRRTEFFRCSRRNFVSRQYARKLLRAARARMSRASTSFLYGPIHAFRRVRDNTLDAATGALVHSPSVSFPSPITEVTRTRIGDSRALGAARPAPNVVGPN